MANPQYRGHPPAKVTFAAVGMAAALRPKRRELLGPPIRPGGGAGQLLFYESFGRM
jgi:hypothetical protein